MAPNNPIFDNESGIKITLLYKGVKCKRCAGFFWALTQYAWEPISIPQIEDRLSLQQPQAA